MAAMRIVQKYGGTSVGSTELIRGVAGRVRKLYEEGHELVVVVSAMSGVTNRLLAQAAEISAQPAARELDSLLATGEQASAALLAMALAELEVPAISLLGHQLKISTDASYGRARIKSIDVSRIEEAFTQRQVVVAAGFQGVDAGQNITTLGRGGSDTTAVALAAALKADSCEILTDVRGVFTTDPRVCDDAVKLDRISYGEMLELASLGAKVLQIRSVEFASRYGVKVHVRSSFDEAEGTWVIAEEEDMEEILVSGVAFERDEAKVTVFGVPDTPGLAASTLGPVANAGIVIDVIVQNVSEEGRTDLTFTVPKKDLAATEEIVKGMLDDIGASGFSASPDVGKVSVVGLGMRNHAGVAVRMFEILAGEQINIQMITTSEIKISVVIDASEVDRAVKVLHREFIGGEQDGSIANTGR